MPDSTPPTSNDFSKREYPQVFKARPAQSSEALEQDETRALDPQLATGDPDASSAVPPTPDLGVPWTEGPTHPQADLPLNGADIAPTFPDLSLTRRQATVDVAAAFLALLLLFSPLGGLLFTLLLSWLPATTNLFEGLLIGGVSVCTVALVMIARRHGPSTIGLGRPRGLDLLWALATIPACYISLFAVGAIGMAIHFYLESDVNKMIAERQAFMELLPERNLLGFFLIGAFTGFHEELLFRGFLLSRFTTIVNYRWLAMFVCAGIFGLLHYFGQGWLGVFQTAGIGAVLGSVTLLARSLWPAVIAHAAFNSIQLALFPLLDKFLEQYMPPPGASNTTTAPALILFAWL